MHWEVDYTSGFETLTDEVILLDSKENENMAKDIEDILAYLHVYESQYVEKINPEKWKRIKWLYQQLAEVAFVNDGRVILDIDDKENIARLKYIGKSIMKTCEENDKTGITLASLFYLYDCVSIDHEKQHFILSVYEKLYDQVMIDSKSESLEEIRDRLRRRNHESEIKE